MEILFLSQELVIFKLYDFKEIFKQAIVVGIGANTRCQLLSGSCSTTCACAESVHTFDVFKFELELVWSHRFVYFGCILGKRDEGGNNFRLFGPDNVHFGKRHCCVMLVCVRKIEL